MHGLSTFAMLLMALPGLIAALAGGIVFAEVLGYIVHRLLHSHKIARLTNLHMIHHQEIYPPRHLRSESYISPPNGRVLGVGLEWLVPISLVTVPAIWCLGLLGFSVVYIGVFVLAALLWTSIFLSYMHDAFHIRKIWLLRSTWFKRLRKLHDLHHLDMRKNFGICSFTMDRLLGTFKGRWR